MRKIQQLLFGQGQAGFFTRLSDSSLPRCREHVVRGIGQLIFRINMAARENPGSAVKGCFRVTA